MFSPDQYQLLDFGDGRRLETFGPLKLDRPCTGAEHVGRSEPEAWESADARFQRTDDKLGHWTAGDALPQRWSICHGPVTLELKRTEFGHLGVFPEQAANWDWITETVRGATGPVRLLNLFAYTGGGTLAAAAAGAEVTHVDAARNVVAWARRNAEQSGLAGAPIRWIAEDALKFVRRELKRASRYDAVVLDPPSYGHGAGGEVWRLSKHLGRLLQMCGRLTANRRQFLLLTCHTPKFGPQQLREILAHWLEDSQPGTITAGPMKLLSRTGRELACGVAARWACTARQ